MSWYDVVVKDTVVILTTRIKKFDPSRRWIELYMKLQNSQFNVQISLRRNVRQNVWHWRMACGHWMVTEYIFSLTNDKDMIQWNLSITTT